MEYFDVCQYKSFIVRVRCPEPELEEQIVSAVPTMKIFLLILGRPFNDLVSCALYTGREAGYRVLVHCRRTCRRWRCGVHLAMVAAIAVERECDYEIIERIMVRRFGMMMVVSV